MEASNEGENATKVIEVEEGGTYETRLKSGR